MGFPPEPDSPPVVKPEPTSQTMAQQPPIDMTPWQYQPTWDPIRARKEQREKAIVNLKRRLKQFGAFSSLTLFFYLAIAVFATILIAPEIMQNLLTRSASLFVITPSIVHILSIGGAALVGYFVFLLLAILISYLYSMGESLLPVINEIILGKPGRHSTILTIGGLFSAVLVVNFVYYLLVESSGVSPNVPDFGSEPLWASTFDFANASVWEEIISRVLLIGIPLLWIDFLFRRKQSLPPIRYFVGGKMKFGFIECALILFSATMFGFAHVGGWDIWKVFPSLISGLCFGYLFVRIGLYAAIVFHFAFDFLTVPTSYFGAGASLLLDVFILLWVAAGLMFIIYYSIRLVRFLRESMSNWARGGRRVPQN